MAFRWRGISGSAIAARTAFVDREAEPTVIALPAPVPAPTVVKPAAVKRPAVKPAAESLLFAVAAERPTRGDRKRFKYESATAAETAARRIVTGRGGAMSLWLYDGENQPVEIAVVLRDALDKVWTQVTARPDQRSYL